MFIYKITNLINDKFYIGKTILTIEKRFEQHIRQSKNKNCKLFLHRAIRKYGKENFKVEQICECKNIKGLNRLEKFFIKKLNPYLSNKIGYNMMEGGHGGLQGKEGRKKISQANYRRWSDPKKREEQSKKLMGRVLPREGIERSRIKNTGRKAKKKTRIKMSIAQNRRFESLEERKKCVSVRVWTEEMKSKMRKKMKKRWKLGLYDKAFPKLIIQ